MDHLRPHSLGASEDVATPPTARPSDGLEISGMAAALSVFANALSAFTPRMTNKRERVAGIVPAPGPSINISRRAVETHIPDLDPRSVRTPEEFVSKMRQLRAYTGLTYREISERAGMHGELPKSTLGDVLNKKVLPKDTLLRHYLLACGLTDEQAAVWENTRRRIAMEEAS